ncbi:MAG: hypothetical protein ACLTEK_00735 [Christensenellales bacterium]
MLSEKNVVQTFKAVNRFTVLSGGRVVSAHNTVLNLTGALSSGLKYAGFIALGAGGGLSDGALAEPLCVLAAEPDEYNADPSRGGLFAVYTVRVTDSELAAGASVSEAGLTPSLSGALVNYASFEPVVKTEGEDILIKSEIYLDFSSEKLMLTAGLNPLAEIMLGLKPFGGRTYAIAHGGNYHKTAVMPRGASDITETAEAAPVFSGNTIAFSAEFSSSPYELMLTIDGVCALRGFYASGAHIESLSGFLRINGSVEHKNKHVLSFFNVKSGGVEVAYYYELPIGVRVTFDCPELIEYRLAKNARFISEPGGRYLAVADDKEITVYTLVSGRLSALYKVGAGGAAADLCSDGSLFVGGGVLTGYIYADGVVQKRTFGAYTGVSEVCAVRQSAVYQLGVVASGDFYLVSISGDDVSETDWIAAVPSDFTINKHDSCFIDYWSIALGVYKSAGVLGNNVNNQNRLKYYLENKSFDIFSISGRWIFMKTLSTNLHVLVNFENILSYRIAEDETLDFCGEYVVSYKDGELNRIIGWNGSNLSCYDLPVDGQLKRPRLTAVFGGYILMLAEDGSVRTLYPVEYGRTLFCPYLTKNTSVTYEALVADDPMSGGTKVRADLELVLGGEE